MKTKNYNPSQLEVTFAEVIEGLQDQLEDALPNNKIVSIKKEMKADNPALRFYLEDTDGDKHEVVIKIIQKADPS